MDQRGVADVSEKARARAAPAPPPVHITVRSRASQLYHRVTKYHAQIGANVKKEVLTQLEWHLLAEAKDLFHSGKYEEALNTFTHCLAVTEKTRSSKDLAVRGAIVHNIASCLHHLGELEAAQDYYEQAIGSFEKAETPALERIMYGDANKRRVDFVKERLIDIQWNRKPDNDVFLDENGRKKPIAAPPEHVEDSALSRRWGDDGVPPPPAWADETNTPMDDYSDYPYERKPAWLSSKGGGSREPARSYAHVGQGGYDDDDDEYGAGPAGSSAMRHDMAPPPESSAAAEEDEDTIDDEGQARAAPTGATLPVCALPPPPRPVGAGARAP